MKSKKNLLEQIKSLPHFTKSTVYQLGIQLGLKRASVDTYISRFLRYKEILSLKRGLYISADSFTENKSDISYSFYLANIIYKPSYVSSWTALQYYNLTTDVVHGITSVTQKVTRSYDTKVANFSYQSIQKELFSDFILVEGKFNFFIATPAKALFDLLYFKTRQFRGVKWGEIKSMIEGLRIDIDEMDKGEQRKFYEMIKKQINHE